MDIRTPHIRTPYIGTPSIKAQSVGASLVTGATKDVIATPVIALTGNSVTITCDTTGATIYYTLDSSTPTSSSSQYSAAFTLDSSCTIKAIAIKGGKSSAVAEESYVKPITYLSQWKIVGNSEVHTLPYADIPQGYTKCKYLEFHGTEYFESGIASKEGIGITCRFKTTTAEKFLFGVRNGNNQDLTNYKSSFALYPKANSRALIGYGSTLQDVSGINLIDGVEHTLQLDDTIAKVDNTDITFTRETLVTPWNIPIGTAMSGGVIDSRYYIGYLYSFILYDANGTLFNGIPCLDDNGVPCLYDTISGTTLYNQGTGTFGYEIEPQPTEIWSCGEYNPIDGKYHILVQPQGGSIADIALNEPLRKVNNVADTIEFPSETEGKALVTRPFRSDWIKDISNITQVSTTVAGAYRFKLVNNAKKVPDQDTIANILCNKYPTTTGNQVYTAKTGIADYTSGNIYIYDADHNTTVEDFKNANADTEVIYELKTPTTELVDAPQIEEAESYTCEISQGAKAVEWSSFETE